MSFSARFFKMHKRTLLALIFGLAFSATLAYAVPPSGGYNAGATLNPDCAPGTTDCSVIIGNGGVWGSITGTLSAQTDLQNALDGKFDDPIGDTSQYIRGDGSLATFTGGSQDLQSVTDIGATTTADVYVNSIGIADPIGGTYSQLTNFLNNITISSDNGDESYIGFDLSNGIIGITANTGFNTYLVSSSTGSKYITLPDANGTLALSVNGNTADSAGNITLSTGGAWGTITGTLSAQTDLQNALNAKFNVPSGTTLQYIRGDGSLATFTTSGLALEHNSTPNSSQARLNLVQGAGITLTDTGGGDILIDGQNLYTADGTISGARVVSYADNLFFTDTGSIKTGLFLDVNNQLSTLGSNPTDGLSYVQVDNNNNYFTIANASLNIPGGNAGDVLTNNGTGVASWQAPTGGGGGSGTVTNFSFTDGNGFTGSVANTTTTPTLSLTLQDAAADGATKGQATFDSNDFNASSGLITIDYTNAQAASSSTKGFLTAADWSAFTAKFDTPSGTISQYVRGDGTLGTLPAGLSLPITIENTSSLFSTGLTGTGSGSTAIDAIFLGVDAGNSATAASRSLFLGLNAGSAAANAAQSIFLGTGAGDQDTVNNTAAFDDISTFAKTSILIGHHTSTGGFSNSIALGAYAANTAANQFVVGSTTRPITSVRIGGGQGTGSASTTVFIGNSAGGNATNASLSNFIGAGAGNNATDATFSNFFGYGAGSGADRAFNANFIGAQAGDSADDANSSNFIGAQAGFSATNANDAVFIGTNAGYFGTNTNNSIFLGKLTGSKATNAAKSTFIGYRAGGYSGVGGGFGALNAANAIFLGSNAGFQDTVNNTGSADDFSILIGNNTSTGGFSNSIALGANATNTAANQFVIGSTTRPIDSTVFYGTGGTSCTITTGTSMSCSSDERLKTNIEDLTTDTLDTLLNIRTVTYNWNSSPDGNQMVGFLAQDLQQYFPQLVSTGPGDYLQVNYAGMTPILVEAIREMNLKIIDINDLTKENSWRDAIVSWLGSASNGIGSFFSKEVHTDTLCVKKSDGSELCLTGDQLQNALNNQGTTIVVPTPPTPAPTVEPDPTVLEITPEETTPEPISDPVPETPITDPVASPETLTPAQ